MKNRLPVFLTILHLALPAFLAINAGAADIQVTVLSNQAFRVNGGTGDQAWHIQYGSQTTTTRLPRSQVLTLSGQENIAYFTHENWLRRIDAVKGVVTGRWHFPGVRITALDWKDGHIQVRVEDFRASGESREGLSRTIDFDPDHPKIPFWPAGSAASAGVAELEAHCCRGAGFNDVAQANQWLDEAENSVRRDPLSPWLRIELAHIYKALGRPEAGSLFEQAVRIEAADYSDLLRLSSTLDDEGLPELAREAFERGYAEYWKRGIDPRFNTVPIGELLVYPNPRKISDALRPELIERRYKMGPWVEAAGYAWDSYADDLGAAGKSQEAALWHSRASEARQNSLYIFGRTILRWYETAFAVVPAVHLAAVLFILVLFVRYGPQRRLIKRAQQAGAARQFTLFNIEFWSRSDRMAFLLIAIASWLSLGSAGALTRILVRQNSVPLNIGMGSFGGPATTWYLENRIAPTAERDLILAIGYQQEDEPGKAEPLYRQLTQFPESWNNLGVLLQAAGKSAEARQAFEQAVRLEPDMPEARWNLDHKQQTFWTELHQKFVPDRGMIAPPSREHFISAFGANSPGRLALQALAGPFTGYAMMQANARFVIPRPFIAGFILTVIEVAGALLILFVVPYRDVTQPAYRWQIVLEYLVPGTAAQWRVWGGVVLVAWSAFLLQWLASLAGIGTVAFGGFPNIQRFFGVPAAPQPSNVFQLNAPYMLAGLVLLYAMNAVLIWRGSRTRM